MDLSKLIFEYLILALEFVSAGVIIIGILLSLIYTTANLIKKVEKGKIYHILRVIIGRSILIGLELLIAADIIRSLTLELTLQSAGLLGVIVLIRTFLSFSLRVEISGRWPWQKK